MIRVQSEQGDYVIETDDPDFVIAVGKGGGVTLEDRQKNRKYNVKVVRQDKGGQEELEVTDADADLSFHAADIHGQARRKGALKAWFEAQAGRGAAPPAERCLDSTSRRACRREASRSSGRQAERAQPRLRR